jgi:hypothetical protein
MKRKKEVDSAAVVGWVIFTIIFSTFVWGMYQLLLPSWKFSNGEMLAFIAVMDTICAFITGSMAATSYERDEPISLKVFLGNLAILVVIIIIALIGWFTSGKMFHSAQYQQVAEICDGNFQADFTDISKEDINNMSAIVDLDTARKLGDRTVGGIKNSSWYEVDDEYNLIVYQGTPYRVSSLAYGGVFKYGKAGSIPGYVLVNANTQEAKYVEVEGGMKYSPSAYFSYDLERHLRKLYPKYSFGNSYFEIDDFGNPYWITSVKETTYGMFGCRMETKFLVTDSRDGSTEEYTHVNLPEWVEHSYSLEYLMKVVHWHYQYVNGFWNLSSTGVYKTTYDYRNSEEQFYGYNSFVNKNGQVFFYTGLTPASRAESNVGFIAINTRTGDITQYNVAGAEEDSAQEAAKGLVQHLGYNATFPTVVNVGGEETYLMALKDNAGLIQKYALVNIKNYSIAVESETIEETIKKYLDRMGIASSADTTEEVEETQTKKGKISKVYSAEIDGTTYFYYVLANDTSVYKASIKVNEMQILLNEGDSITIEFVDGEGMKKIVSIQ